MTGNAASAATPLRTRLGRGDDRVAGAGAVRVRIAGEADDLRPVGRHAAHRAGQAPPLGEEPHRLARARICAERMSHLDGIVGLHPVAHAVAIDDAKALGGRAEIADIGGERPGLGPRIPNFFQARYLLFEFVRSDYPPSWVLGLQK